MITAITILLVIFGGLGVYLYFSNRYFNDLYGESSILTRRQSVFINRRFSPLNFTFFILNLIMVLVALILLYFATFIIKWNSQSGLLINIFFIFGSLFLLTLSFSELLIQRKLKQINSHEYIFDPSEKSLEIVGIIKFTNEDILLIESIGIGRDLPLKRIILKNRKSVLLTKYLPCFDVIDEFFDKNLPRSYSQYNQLVFVNKLIKNSIT